MSGDEDKRKKEIQFCPVCGSTAINWIGGLAILNPHLECRDCGHRGIFVTGSFKFSKKVREDYFAKRDKQLE